MDSSQKDVLLVQMPVTWLHPSLAIGLLKSDLVMAGLSNEVVYASHHYVDYLGESRFHELHEHLDFFYGGWEMLFGQFTDFQPMIDAKTMLRRIEGHEEEGEIRVNGQLSGATKRIKELICQWDSLSEDTERFLEHETETILDRNPRIVACSIMTQQRNAALSLFKRIKEKAPEVITILGGGHCSGDAGPALLEGSPSLDYCFSGDGDYALGDGCRMLLEGDLEGLRKKHPEFLRPGDTPVNRAFCDMNACLIPDYSEYFEQIKNNRFETMGDYILVAEGSRGCWWGQKGGCRFCGLHSSEQSVHFRGKSPDRLFSELKELSVRYGVARFILSDTILDMNLIRSLPEQPPLDREHLNIFAECKSNLRADHLYRLKNNGFNTLQPGIEALSDELLDLMHKGVRLIQQLAFLKYSRQFEIFLYWNIMYSLPTEQEEWYDNMLELMEHLHYLQPPTAVVKMMLARNSEFFREHEKYGLQSIRPLEIELACCPDEIYACAVSDFFESPELLDIPGLADRIQEAVTRWKKDYKKGSRLELMQLEDRDVIRDLRVPGTRKMYHLTGLRRKLYQLAYEVISEREVVRRLQSEEEQEQTQENSVSKQEIEDAITFFTQRHLMFRKDGMLLALAVPTNR